MTLPTISQHGVPFDPERAKKSRAAKEAAASRAQVDVKRLRVRAEPEQLSPMKAHARMLDEVESAWKERARDRRG